MRSVVVKPDPKKEIVDEEDELDDGVGKDIKDHGDYLEYSD
jgi:hypothetical protein